MLEKNKDYVEFTLQCTTVERSRDRNYREVCFNGYSDSDFPGVPMDVVCKEFGHKVVMISKRDFDRLQGDNQHYREMAKQWEENYNLLLKKTGFDTIESLVFYLTNAGLCGTLLEALAKLRDREKYICSERDSERDRAKTLQEENEQLKKKLAVPDPFADYKELLEKLYSKDDVEKFEWTLNHICGGRASVNGWMVSSKLWRRNYETLSKLVGFSSTEEIQDYLTNEAECDTLQEAILKLIKENKYACDEWYSANSNNNSWKAAAECNSPKELIEKREALEKEIDVYSRALKEWREGTGCPSPSAAKTMIESQASWCHAYHEVKKENEKLEDDVNSWKNVTEYSTPEDYLAARISGAFNTPFDYTAAWQKATGCDTSEQAKSSIENLEKAIRLTNKNMLSALDSEIDEWQKATGCNAPDDAKKRIKALNERIDDSEACYNHLLMLTGFSDEGEIEDALDQCDHSTLRKALVDYEFDYEELLKLTGYKRNQDIRVELNHGEQFVYKDMRELINSLKRKAKFIESNWQHATGCDTPGRAEEKLEFYKERLGKAVQAASCAAKHLENIMS